MSDKSTVVLPYQIIKPSVKRVPILLSIPHCGTSFPDELKGDFKKDMMSQPDDTDWFVQNLYDFAPAMGIGIIHSVNSRWVVDLNRDPQSKPLYTDGRIITPLCPTTDFFGNPIYNDERKEVSREEVTRRTEIYYEPYHAKLKELLADVKAEFGKVLLWECHSIRQFVPTIHKEKFPDLILGDADGTSAASEISEIAASTLKKSRYKFSHNYPFKGGYITRQFCNPKIQEHALQLEMSKVNYMDDSEKIYDPVRANAMREVLKETLSNLSHTLLK